MQDAPSTDEQRREEDRGDLQAILFGAVAAAAVIMLLVAAFVIGYHRGQASVEGGAGGGAKAQTGGGGSGGAAAKGGAAGQAAFKSACGSCHALKAAGATGASGPDLDILKPDAQRVLSQIENGGATMPANLLSGKKAQEVADYVAQNAGK